MKLGDVRDVMVQGFALLTKCRFVKLRLTKWLLSIAKLFGMREIEIKFSGANVKFSKK